MCFKGVTINNIGIKTDKKPPKINPPKEPKKETYVDFEDFKHSPAKVVVDDE